MDRTRIYWVATVLPTLTEEDAARLIVKMDGAIQPPEKTPYDPGECEWRVKILEITTSGTTLKHALNRWTDSARRAIAKRRHCPACDERHHIKQHETAKATKPAKAQTGRGRCPSPAL